MRNGREVQVNPESNGEKLKKYWSELSEYNKKLFKNDTIVDQEEWSEDKIRNFEKWGEKTQEVHKYLVEQGMTKYLDHDLGGPAGYVFGTSDFVLPYLKENKKIDEDDFRMMRLLELSWKRFWASIEDVMLRSFNEIKISPEFVNGLDLGLLEEVMVYFTEKELAMMRQGDKAEGAQYFGSADRDLHVDVDFEGLKEKLSDKKVKINNGFLINFVLNALRNGFKNRHEAKNIYLDIDIEGDSLVVRVMDDGKGVDEGSLDPTNVDEFIFKEGVSGSKGRVNKGLGLADFHKRIETIGGEVNVVSYRDGEKKENSFKSLDASLSLDKINQNRENKVNTVFETRFPIIEK